MKPRFPLFEELAFGIVLLFLSSGILSGIWVLIHILRSAL